MSIEELLDEMYKAEVVPAAIAKINAALQKALEAELAQGVLRSHRVSEKTLSSLSGHGIDQITTLRHIVDRDEPDKVKKAFDSIARDLAAHLRHLTEDLCHPKLCLYTGARLYIKLEGPFVEMFGWLDLTTIDLL